MCWDADRTETKGQEGDLARVRESEIEGLALNEIYDLREGEMLV